MEHSKLSKEIKVGRVVMITQGRHHNKLAIILVIRSAAGKPTTYKALVLDDQYSNATNKVIYMLKGNSYTDGSCIIYYQYIINIFLNYRLICNMEKCFITYYL